MGLVNLGRDSPSCIYTRERAALLSLRLPTSTFTWSFMGQRRGKEGNRRYVALRIRKAMSSECSESSHPSKVPRSKR